MIATAEVRRGRRTRGIVVVSAAVVLAMAGAVTVAPMAEAVPPFPVEDSGSGTVGQVNGKWAVLSNSSSTAGRYTSDGWTRLTPATPNLRTNMVNNAAFPSSSGFQVEFDYRMTGGAVNNAGDGMSVYLIDGASAASAGGTGSGLAYANSESDCGVAGGYLGVGLDYYGGFARSDARNSGGPGATPKMIGVRGSGAPCSTTNTYPWVAGKIDADLGTSTTGDPATYASSTFRRVRISVEPRGAALQLTVSITAAKAKNQVAGAFASVLTANLSGVSGQAPLPSTLKLGFGASTGSATNYMDVRNIDVRAFTDAQAGLQLSPSTPGHAGFPAGTFLPGDPIAFQATARNNGPTVVGNAPSGVAVLYDDLADLPLADVSWTCAGGGGGVCITGGGSGSVVSEDWTGPTGGSVTVTATATVATTVSAGTHTTTAIVPTNFTTMTVDPDLDTVQRDGGAADTDGSNNSAAATFAVALVADPAASTITADPAHITADGDSTITVHLIDVNGNPLTVGGDTVSMSTDLGTLSAVTDHGDGSYTAILAASAPGTATIGFTLDGTPAAATASVEVVAGIPSADTSTISAAPVSILGDGSSVITVTLIDANANPVAAGGNDVVMTTTLGVIGPVADNGDGTYTATLTGDGANGEATIGFAIDDATVTATATVDIAAASSTTSTIAAAPSTITADGTSTSTLTVTLRDIDSNPLTVGGDDVTIDFVPDAQTTAAVNAPLLAPVVPTDTGTLTPTTDNGDGTYTAVLTAPIQTGSSLVGFAIDSLDALDTTVVTFTSPLAVAPPGPIATGTIPAALATTGSTRFPFVPLLLAALAVAAVVLIGAVASRRRVR